MYCIGLHLHGIVLEFLNSFIIPYQTVGSVVQSKIRYLVASCMQLQLQHGLWHKTQEQSLSLVVSIVVVVIV